MLYIVIYAIWSTHQWRSLTVVSFAIWAPRYPLFQCSGFGGMKSILYIYVGRIGALIWLTHRCAACDQEASRRVMTKMTVRACNVTVAMTHDGPSEYRTIGTASRTKENAQIPPVLFECTSRCHLYHNSLKTHNNFYFWANSPDGADGQRLEFSLVLSRRRKLYNKSLKSFRPPILHTRNLASHY